jgi:uncharacterized protein YigA (DUF484 family)
VTVNLISIPGLTLALLACAGLADIVSSIAAGLAKRFRVDVRHLRVHRRWDRPGAHVTFQGGRRAVVSEVIFDTDAGGIVIIQPYHEEGEFFQPEWVSLGDLSPLPCSAVSEPEGTVS